MSDNVLSLIDWMIWSRCDGDYCSIYMDMTGMAALAPDAIEAVAAERIDVDAVAIARVAFELVAIDAVEPEVESSWASSGLGVDLVLRSFH